MEEAINKKSIFSKPLKKSFKGFFFILLFFTTCFSYAQVNSIDSIAFSLKTKPKPFGGLSTRYTFINTINSPVVNLKLGLSFNNTISFALGYAFLKENNFSMTIKRTSNNKDSLVIANFFMNYFNASSSYVFHKTKKWEFSVLFLFGFGNSYLNNSSFGEIKKNTKRFITLYEPSVSGHYKIIPWFGVGADIGYRIMLKNNKVINQRLNSPVYGFKTILFFEEIYKLIKKNSTVKLLD